MQNLTTFSRDELGLLSHIHYPKNPDGTINWRALISPAHLYVNPDYEAELKTRFNVSSRRDIDVTKVPDHQLLVTLDGWRELLRLRGYRSVRYPILTSSATLASATCEIEFLGNYETNGQAVIHSDTADASVYSVSGKFQLFLSAMAANRAFARTVRTFLNVPIYGKDEFDPEANKGFETALKSGSNPLITPVEAAVEPKSREFTGKGLLKDKCSNRKKVITFEALKTRAIEVGDLTSDPSTWESFDSIPDLDAYTLLTRIEKSDTEKKAKK